MQNWNETMQTPEANKKDFVNSAIRKRQKKNELSGSTYTGIDANYIKVEEIGSAPMGKIGP